MREAEKGKPTWGSWGIQVPQPSAQNSVVADSTLRGWGLQEWEGRKGGLPRGS